MVASRCGSRPPSDRSQCDAQQASNSIAAQRPNNQSRVPGARSRSHPGTRESILGDNFVAAFIQSLPTCTRTAMRVKSHGRGITSPMHLGLASTGGRRGCGFRVAAHTIVSVDKLCFLQDGDQAQRWFGHDCFARPTKGQSKGRASPHALLRCDDARSDDPTHPHRTAWHCARNVEAPLPALPGFFATRRAVHRVRNPCSS